MILGFVLYFDDLKNRGAILDKVEAGTTTDMMTSPVIGRRTEGDGNDNDYEMKEGEDNDEVPVAEVASPMDVYKENSDLRASLKRSLAR